MLRVLVVTLTPVLFPTKVFHPPDVTFFPLSNPRKVLNRPDVCSIPAPEPKAVVSAAVFLAKACHPTAVTPDVSVAAPALKPIKVPLLLGVILRSSG